ncbi:MAG: sulfite exporter TauE/SafE family protein [Candidatus Dormibacteraeota bacterium]|nr:sulfite exporter TauE/SafE family protein [Candidatus Dormibacteraeota bacterium]
MVVLLGLSQHVAQGTSLVVIIPTAVSGSITHFRMGNVRLRTAAWLSVGGSGRWEERSRHWRPRMRCCASSLAATLPSPASECWAPIGPKRRRLQWRISEPERLGRCDPWWLGDRDCRRRSGDGAQTRQWR